MFGHDISRAIAVLLLLIPTSLAAAEGKYGPFYPDDAVTVKRLFSSVPQAGSTMTFQVLGSNPDPTTQIMVYDPRKKLFCWSQPFAVGAPVFLRGRNINVTAPLYCEDGKSGSASVSKQRGKRYLVKISVKNGPKFSEAVDF